MPFPGIAVLIPDFLREIEKLWISGKKSVTPDDVQNKALLILLSLINYPVHFERVNEPFSADQLHSQLAAVLVSAVNYPPITPANKSLALWALGLFVFLDLFGHPPKERLSETLKALVESCSSPHPLVAHTALEAVSSLISSSEGLERINAVDPGLVSYIIESLSDDIIIAISTIKTPAYASPHHRHHLQRQP
jgi:hypothetical protein